MKSFGDIIKELRENKNLPLRTVVAFKPAEIPN
jgi:hypothetical protein